MKLNVSTLDLPLGKVTQLDCTEPQIVEVLIDEKGKRLWINVNGVCLFRACRIEYLVLIDNRQSEFATQVASGSADPLSAQAGESTAEQ